MFSFNLGNLAGQSLGDKGEQHARAQEAKQVEKRLAGVHPLLLFSTKQSKDPANASDNHGSIFFVTAKS